jgi:hypothetical protein
MNNALNFKKLNESLTSSQLPQLHLEAANISQSSFMGLNNLEQSLF